LPQILDENKKWKELKPNHVREIKALVDENRKLNWFFDIVVEETSPGDDPIVATEKVMPWAEAGATWWIELMWNEKDPEKLRQRIRQGPPKL
jgi:hypothetical protein